jgi:hypothetical protein
MNAVVSRHDSWTVMKYHSLILPMNTVGGVTYKLVDSNCGEPGSIRFHYYQDKMQSLETVSSGACTNTDK